MSGTRLDKKDRKLLDGIVEKGGELLAPTNEWELMRFKTKYGVGVVHFNKRGVRSYNEAAEKALDHIRSSRPGKLSIVKVHGRRKGKGSVNALIERDGDDCFFCGHALEDDITVEHLVSVAHGGPNHLSNLFLAHDDCNRAAGHLSAPEKIAMRDTLRAVEATDA